MYAIVSMNDVSYQPLADITWENNKVPYAKKHGYLLFNKVYPSSFPTFGWERWEYVHQILKSNSDIEWIWMTGTDSLITNTNIKIEDKIDNNYHFIVSVDFNTINADSLLFRNTPEGINFIENVLSLKEQFRNDFWHENAAMIYELNVPRECVGTWPEPPYYGMREKYRNVAKIMHQRYMNSYNYNLYRYRYTITNDQDKLGVYGNWEVGDWLIHWPATTLQDRMQLANHYMNLVV